MGLFDFLKSSPEAIVAKHGPRVANKRGQASDRWESIQALGAVRSADSVKALLARFTFYADPSITDGEEKDEAFRLILQMGDLAVPPVRAFASKAESVSWALKILERLATDDEVVEVLLGLLGRMDVEYERDPQRKLQVLTALEERRDPRIGAGVVRFLEDVHETARFHAASTVLQQEDAKSHAEALAKLVSGEDSVRIKALVLEAFAQRGWSVGEQREKIQKGLPPGFSIDAQGVPVKR